MKTGLLVLGASLLTSLCAQAQQFTPITVSGFNADVIVGPTETTNGTVNAGATTQTYDGGNANSTFYAVGTNPNALTTGLPTGTTFAVQAGNGTFTLAAAAGNNAVYNGGTLTLTGTATRYTSLDILGSSGNSGNGTQVTFTINYADGTSQTTGGNQAAALDWFNGDAANTGNIAFVAGGRVNVQNSGFETNGNNPKLFYSTVALTNVNSAVTSVVINGNGVNSDSVFALSGIAVVPEPSSVGMLLGGSLLAGFAWVRTRRAPKLS